MGRKKRERVRACVCTFVCEKGGQRKIEINSIVVIIKGKGNIN